MGDYALRAMTEIAAADPSRIKAERIARSQRIPLKFVENILITLKHAGLINAMRGAAGGYWLARPASEITLADIIRAVEGPLANVRGTRPDQLRFSGPATALADVWIAVRVNLRNVLEAVTLEHVVRTKLPPPVMRLTRGRDARRPH
jgi:Rrf2 family protein